MPDDKPIGASVEKADRAARERDAERRSLVEAYKRIEKAKTFAEKLAERRKISIKKK